MSRGRTALLGLAVASAVALQLAPDLDDAGVRPPVGGHPVLPVLDSDPEPGVRPPVGGHPATVAIVTPFVPAAPIVTLVAATTLPVAATLDLAVIGFAPKTSPPRT